MPALPGPESPNFEEFKRTKRNSNEATGRVSGCGSPHLSLFPKAPFLFESPAIGDSGCEQMEMIELSCTWAGQACTSKHRKSNQAERTRAPPDILTEFSEPTSTILDACKFTNHPPRVSQSCAIPLWKLQSCAMGPPVLLELSPCICFVGV